MTTAIFGKPGVTFTDPALLEQATLVYRAIHTLERLAMHDVIWQHHIAFCTGLMARPEAPARDVRGARRARERH